MHQQAGVKVMKKAFWMTLVTLLGTALCASRALAQDHGHDKDKDKDRDERVEHRDHDRDRDRHHDHDRDHDRDPFRAHHRDHDRDDRDFRRAKGDPPGWSHGRKTGWDDRDVPLGQAKKHAHHHRHQTRVAESGTTKPIVKRPPQPTPKPVVVRRPTDLIGAHATEQTDKR
jgi:hypothetical protein